MIEEQKSINENHNESENLRKNLFTNELNEIFGEYLNNNNDFDYKLFTSFLIEKVILDFINSYEISEEMITDGANDSGIDAFYYKKEENQLCLLQTKYSTNININDFELDLIKIQRALEYFILNKNEIKEFKTFNKDLITKFLDISKYTNKNKKFKIKIFYATINNIQMIQLILNEWIQKLKTKLDINVEIYFLDQEELLQNYKYNENSKLAKNIDLELIDKNKYFELENPNNGIKTIFCGIKASSLIAAFNKNKNEILSKNLRGYISMKKVDKAIEETLKNTPQEFIMLNNGITIIGELKNNYSSPDGNLLKFKELSIINGGQTITLLSKLKDIEKIKKIEIFAKIIITNTISKNKEELIKRISLASNNQKPIKPEDYWANEKYVEEFKQNLENGKDNNIIFLPKRDTIQKQEAIKNFKKQNKVCIAVLTLKELVQIFASFYLLEPSKSRSAPKILLETEEDGPVSNTIQTLKNINNKNIRWFLNDIILLFNFANDYKKENSKDQYLPSDIDKNIYQINKYGLYYLMGVMGSIFILNKTNKKEQELISEGKRDTILIHLKKIRETIQLTKFIKRSEFHNYDDNFNFYPSKEFKENLYSLFYEIFRIIEFQNREAAKLTSWSNILKTETPFLKVIYEIFENLRSKNNNIKKLVEKIFI